jgi:hydroxylamine reductase (hybrid-cluster protein)
MGWRATRLLAYGAAVAVLLGVFALYTSPTILVTLSDQIWACFN